MTQASIGLGNLKIGESPAKKLIFESMDKGNHQPVLPIADNIDLNKPQLDLVKEEKPPVSEAIKASEAEEPLLQENPHRFVLFPIKYHEVRAYQRVMRHVSNIN